MKAYYTRTQTAINLFGQELDNLIDTAKKYVGLLNDSGDWQWVAFDDSERPWTFGDFDNTITAEQLNTMRKNWKKVDM